LSFPNKSVADSIRILLIDDDDVDRAAVRRALGQSGLAHELVEAPDGTSGGRIAAEQRFDCVLLDYRLPDVDTFALLAALQTPDGGANSVMMLTGEGDQGIAFRLMRAGALDYLTKSEVTPSSLARAIRYAGARREFLRELHTARKEAEQKSLELATLNRQKALLFSIVAHDLRNPFHAILGLSTLLGKAVVKQDHASVARRAQALNNAATQAYELMGSLLTWARIQMDTVEVPIGEVDLSLAVEEAMAPMLETAADKGIRLSPPGAATVIAHRAMLVTVLRNLISNAVKFTFPGGRVAITATRQGSNFAVAVTDTGVGMAPAIVEDLFSSDKRTATAGTAGERGSGFGLLICRDLVHRMGATLEVQSVIDRGTTLSFSLPAV
jgi:two-component system, sensor histidine kinase and response regulator